MSAQPSLFDAPASRGASRHDGPDTSRTAAHSIDGQVLRDQQALVLTALCDLHRRQCRGGNAWEIQSHLSGQGHGVQQNVVAKRLGELVDLGMALHREGDERPGPSSRPQKVFTPSMAGKAWVAVRGQA